MNRLALIFVLIDGALMSEKDNKNVRRFGRRDRKDKLQKPGSLFPVEDDISEVPDDSSSDVNFEFDIDSLGLPDTDSEALNMLSGLGDEVRAPIITPSEERYPPIAPVDRPSRPNVTPVETSAEKPGNHLLHNIMAFIFILGTIANIIWFVVVWDNPQSTWNPLPPATPFIEVTVIADNSEPVIIDATPDESGQIFVVITDTPMPTAIGTESPYPFISEQILYAPNSNELGCNWWSIAGRVLDFNANPISGYRIRVIGEDVNETVFSGASQAFGDGGYELPLIGTPREAAFTVQLFSPQDAPLSVEIPVSTRADCDSNVMILSFIQNR